MNSFASDTDVEEKTDNTLSSDNVVGGMFGLGVMKDAPVAQSQLFGDERSIFLANARSGINLLIRELNPAQVWFPSYLCNVMLGAVDQGAAAIRFYEIDYDLKIHSREWIKQVLEGDLVIFIDYFGFPSKAHHASLARARGAWILEDASQALLSSLMGEAAHFVLYSPRKFLGVPDGGILINRSSFPLKVDGLTEPSRAWWLKSLTASVMRREFDICGGNREWFPLFQEADKEAPFEPFAMSELSRMLLARGFDYEQIAHKRIKNYRVLADRLGEFALFPRLPSCVVPLGFPARFKNRDEVRRILFSNEIYPQVHWPLAHIVPSRFADSHKLADEILTLVCDQRYSGEQMQRTADLVLKVAASPSRRNETQGNGSRICL